MQYCLKRLRGYEDVREGDLFPNAEDYSLNSSGSSVGIVEFVSTNHFLYYAGRDLRRKDDFIVRGDQIKDIVLFRTTSENLEILAGEHAFQYLLNFPIPLDFGNNKDNLSEQIDYNKIHRRIDAMEPGYSQPDD